MKTNCNPSIWINEFKIALVNENEEKALNLLDSIPIFSDSNLLICARELVKELINRLIMKRGVLIEDMRRLQQIKVFLES